MIDFRTHPDRYRHWALEVDGRIARLDMKVDPAAGIDPGYELKLNSYDLGVDIELADAVQRLRFEHPEVGAVIIGSRLDRVFCAGANIGMLARAPHTLKVNFCKFTNETRNAIEDASTRSGQRYIAAINGTAAGGGYELALATDHIMLIDDRNAAVSLPEVSLLGVLPGTGGLTRLVDKRHVRRDRADVFCTVEEGIKGEKAVEWGLVDEAVPSTRFEEAVLERARQFAGASPRPDAGPGVELVEIRRQIDGDVITYGHVIVELDREARTAVIILRGPAENPPSDEKAAVRKGCEFWPLAAGRDLDDAILHLRLNELEIGTWVVKTEGDLELLLAHDAFMRMNARHWFIREIELYWKRILQRLDMTSRSIFALIEPGSCFASVFAEVALAADRSYMLIDTWSGEGGDMAHYALTPASLGPMRMSNGLTRLQTRFWGDEEGLTRAVAAVGEQLDAKQAYDLGLVTDAMDDIDWDDEIRFAVQARASFSPDALTGMEANLRFAGPETMETKIFGRLTAWQNWVFQRPNASGESGALRRYGSGIRPDYDHRRV